MLEAACGSLARPDLVWTHMTTTPLHRRPLVWTVAAVVAIPLLALGWWLARPLFVDTVVDEAFPLSAGAVVPDDMTREQVEAEMAAAAGQDVTEMEPMPGAGPTVLASGSFTGADQFHQGAGTATLYALEDGSQVLRLEDFEVTNGPDLHVLLVPEAGAESVDLGMLKGNIGDQNYDVPAGVEIGDGAEVVIYCVPFRVTFATADLA